MELIKKTVGTNIRCSSSRTDESAKRELIVNRKLKTRTIFKTIIDLTTIIYRSIFVYCFNGVDYNMFKPYFMLCSK